jgi:Tol biopolymer transport system component
MRPSHRLWALGAISIAVLGTGLAAFARTGTSHAASPGVIVFASDRAKADPGSITAFALGEAPRDVSRSLARTSGPAVAPVGDRIAFWSERSGVERVYVARGDGTGARMVPGVGGRVGVNEGGTLSFSADGSRLFATYGITRPAPSGRFTNIVYAIDVRRLAARLLHPCEGTLQASPDAARVACGRAHATAVYDLGGNLRFSVAGGLPSWSSANRLVVDLHPQAAPPANGAAVILDESGRTLARVAGTPLRWSPDGRLLAFRRGQAVWVGDPLVPSRARVVIPTWNGGPVDFTPDGRALEGHDAAGRPVLFPVAGGKPVLGGAGGLGAWSPSGRLAYADYAGAYAHAHPGATVAILITDAHGLHPRVVGRVPFDDHGCCGLQWAPDGRHVLVSSSTTCQGKGLFAVSAAGGPTRPLTRDPRDLESPSYSPGGTRIAYSVQRFDCHLGAGEPIHLETVAADGTGATPATAEGDPNAGSFDIDPAFSPAGTTIAFVAETFDSSTIQTIPVQGGPRTVVVAASEHASGQPAWSPDGTRIAFLAGSEIRAVPAGGGPSEVLARNPAANSGCDDQGLAWSPDGTQLAVAGGAGIWLVPIGRPGGARLAIHARCAEYPAFSPDGTRIAFDAAPSDAARPVGPERAIMVANADGSGLQTLSDVPFRQSVHPTWQPVS